MNIENLSTLKIHRLTQSQYDRELKAGRIDENALYLTPDVKNSIPSDVESTEYIGCYYRMVDGEMEWINPPMISGVEYRTIKRRQGAPVYTKFVSGFVHPGESVSLTLNGAVDVIASIKATTGVGVYYDIFDIPESEDLFITDSVLNNDWTVNLDHYRDTAEKPIKFMATFEYTKE